MKNDTDEDTVRENYSAGYMIVLPDEHDENNNMQKPDNTSDLHEDQENNEHPGSGNDCVVDMKLQPSGSDSEAEMSSSSCDEHQKAVNDIEYHEDQCSKSFQDLQETFQPQRSVSCLRYKVLYLMTTRFSENNLLKVLLILVFVL